MSLAVKVFQRPAAPGGYDRYGVVGGAVERRRLGRFKVVRGHVMRQLLPLRVRGVIPGAFVPLISGVVPGSQSYTTPGTYSFSVPKFNTLTATVKGGGGGGGGGGTNYAEGDYSTEYFGTAGGAGALSSFNGAVIANGGGGGQAGYGYGSAPAYAILAATGTSGTATGGDTNTTGGALNGGGYGPSWGGAPNTVTSGGYGGPAGLAVKTYTAGQLTVGALITVVVGQRGANSVGGRQAFSGGGAGGDYGGYGSVDIAWS